MKFHSHLTEAVLLRRTLRFLAEVVLPNKQRLMIRCPNLDEMLSCDILGTKIWYSTALGYHCLPTWELAEVDNGHLVCINPDWVRPLLVEALKRGMIEALKPCQLLKTNKIYEAKRCQILVLEDDSSPCYIGLEHVTLGDERGEGYFPESPGGGVDTLNFLMNMRHEGFRAILFYCVLHTGIETLKPANHIDAEYGKLLREAASEGVEVMAYRAIITPTGMELSVPLPVFFSEDAVSR